jgi:hypothetical protein
MTGRHYQGGTDPAYLRILQNDGDGTSFTVITPPGTIGHWNGGAAWADFNKDGLLDMVVSGSDDQAETARRVRVYLNDGDGTWTAVDLTPGLSLGDVAVGDFNGDGNPDVVAMGTNDGTNEQIRWWAGNGAGGFGAPTNFAAAVSPQRVEVGDFNGDGLQDLAVTNFNSDNVSILLGNGAGGFSAPTNFGTDVVPIGLTIGDFNQDGLQDRVHCC